jgi:hypothetical protein
MAWLFLLNVGNRERLIVPTGALPDGFRIYRQVVRIPRFVSTPFRILPALEGANIRMSDGSRVGWVFRNTVQ